MQLFFQPKPIGPEGSELHLTPDESAHCIKVLRKKVNDEITMVDGSGFYFMARITNPSPKKCGVVIVDLKKEESRRYSIHLVIAPTKNSEKTEWFLEKSLELGIDHVTFITCRNSERNRLNIDRLRKKAISAMKQSLRASLPTLSGLIKLQSYLASIPSQPGSGMSGDKVNQKFIAHIENSEHSTTLFSSAKKNRNYTVLIGPEGGFTETEVQAAIEQDFQKVSLGRNRLRTETAGIVACHTLHIKNE